MKMNQIRKKTKVLGILPQKMATVLIQITVSEKTA